MNVPHIGLFSEARAAQVAAYFLFQARGRLPLLKLIKLMYLAERLSYERFGEPLTGDSLVSMEHGPVLSRTLNHVNGLVQSGEGGWESWIADREGHDVALRDAGRIRSPEEDLLELSDDDLELLHEIWQKFGHLERWKLRDLTHEICAEWQDPNGSSTPISLERLFQALNFSAEKSSALIERLGQQADANAAADID